MVYYKSYCIVEGEPRRVVEDENGNINKNPIKEFFGICDLNSTLKGE